MCTELHYNNLWHKMKLSLSSYFVSKQYITLELKSVSFVVQSSVFETSLHG